VKGVVAAPQPQFGASDAITQQKRGLLEIMIDFMQRTATHDYERLGPTRPD
jgi:hypothetical protein